MTVTAHYIDNSWVLRIHMLRFAYVPAPHTAERLGTVLVNCLLDWNVDSKMMLLLEQEYWKDVSPLQVKPIWSSSNLMLKLLKSKPLVSSFLKINQDLFCLSFVALAAGWNQGMQNAALLLLLESGVWRPKVKSFSCCCAAVAIEVVLEDE
ncbi:unnamed protein product [Linum trigynum]|uniref:Uncharacterized protein n=1 Tax=Linum trigynum TaxID=586398 RepID=A0AAV2CMJ9_9ROSI